MAYRSRLFLAILLAVGCVPALAQNAQTLPAAKAAADEAAKGALAERPAVQRLTLKALFSDEGKAIESGVHWRVFRVKTDETGQMPLVAESTDASPAFQLPAGVYVVHAGYGLAAATRRVEVAAAPVAETLVLNAGGLMVNATINGKPLPQTDLSSRIQAILPNGERRLIAEGVEATSITRLPVGHYFVECVYGDSNAVVSGEIEIKAGQVSNASFRQRAATLTLKLVSQTGGEALANTSWSVLTPGGDVIRESIGAFPSMALAEGQYTVVARHEGHVYQRDFEVQTGLDEDVEVLAQTNP